MEQPVSNDQFVLRVCWGSLTLGGGWMPNPLLKMPEAEQFRQNIESGYLHSAFQRTE